MITFYFSATGNTKFIAELFSRNMNAKCISIEDDFTDEITSHDIIAFCYPIYGSRVPRIMREFVASHTNSLAGKKVIILVTQLLFSGDGARVFTDMLGSAEVIYAEHFNMPNNICNTPLFKKPGKNKIRRYIKNAEAKMAVVCKNIKSGIVVKRGFSGFSKMLGNIQGKPWRTMEQNAKKDVKVDKDCTACNLCIKICPMKNLENTHGAIKQKNNCTVCYRCVNKCPHKAITVWIHRKPKWQYKGLEAQQ